MILTRVRITFSQVAARWATDVFDEFKLTPELLIKLKVNKKLIYRSNSAGDNYNTAFRVWMTLGAKKTTNLRRNSSAFLKWLVDVIGVDVGSVPRYKACLADTTLNNYWIKFLRTLYGRMHFNITEAALIL